MKDTVTLAKSKVPLLGDLPVLGVLFSNRSDQIKKEELVILLTPHVVTGEEFFGPASATASVDWPVTGHRFTEAGHPERQRGTAGSP